VVLISIGQLETDQKLAGIDSTLPARKKDANGSATVRFGPKAPAGQEGNCVQALSGKAGAQLCGPTCPSAVVRQDLAAR
jgi:hypothetical protein